MRSREFVGFVAACLVVGAMATDLMLPALGAIGGELSPGDATLGQTAIVAFLLGMGLPQLLFGPLSDHFGRRPVLLGGCALFVAGGVLTALAQDIAMLIVSRLLQGIGAGALRVAAYAMVRDRHAGPAMARVMSLAMTVLLLEPIVSPLVGQVVLLFGSWRWLPLLVVAAAVAVAFWGRFRLTETRSVEHRRALAAASILAAWREVVTNGQAFAHMLAYALALGAHVGFLACAQDIFERSYDVGLGFTPLLALVSVATSVAAFLSARLSACRDSSALIRRALHSQLAGNTLAVIAAGFGLVGLTEFLVLQSCNMFAFGVLAPNLTAIAMRPFGHIAGTAAAMFGFVTNTLGALLGFAIAQGFDGTVRPLFGTYWILTAAALLTVVRGDRRAGCSIQWAALRTLRHRTQLSTGGVQRTGADNRCVETGLCGSDTHI